MTLHWVHTAAIAKTDEYYSRDHLFKYVFVLDTLSVIFIPLHHWYQSTVAILSQSRIWHCVTATLPVSRVLISCVCCQFLVPLSGFSIILGDLHHNARIENLFGLELLCVCVCVNFIFQPFLSILSSESMLTTAGTNNEAKLNSLGHGIYGCRIWGMIFKPHSNISNVHISSRSCELPSSRISYDPADSESTLVQVMFCNYRATAYGFTELFINYQTPTSCMCRDACRDRLLSVA